MALGPLRGINKGVQKRKVGERQVERKVNIFYY